MDLLDRDVRMQQRTWMCISCCLWFVPDAVRKCEVTFRVKIIAIIMDQEETKKILKYLAKIGSPPPNFDPATLN